MAAPAGSLSPTERLAFCASLAPDIAQVTADFYDPEAPHPYLRSPYGGGVLLREVATRNLENFTQISVHGLSTGDHITAALLERSGLPAEIAPEGILWSIITDHVMYPATLRGTVQPKSYGMSAHSWSYWDGKKWLTSRTATDEQGELQKAEWVASTLMPEELIALKALTKQTRGLHQIADVYRGDTEQFEHDMAQVDVDLETRKWLNVAFASALTMRREVITSGEGMRGFMPYFGTGYQRTGQQTERISLGKEDDTDAVRYASKVAIALANMYRGSAVIKRDSMRKRAYRARIKGRPLPLPAAW